jgi:hypothetical protein
MQRIVKNYAMQPLLCREMTHQHCRYALIPSLLMISPNACAVSRCCPVSSTTALDEISTARLSDEVLKRGAGRWRRAQASLFSLR